MITDFSVNAEKIKMDDESDLKFIEKQYSFDRNMDQSKDLGKRSKICHVDESFNLDARKSAKLFRDDRSYSMSSVRSMEERFK